MGYTNHWIHVYFEYITVAPYTIGLDQVTFHNTFLYWKNLVGFDAWLNCVNKITNTNLAVENWVPNTSLKKNEINILRIFKKS